MGILTLFTCYSTLLSATVISQLAIITQAVLTLTGRVTMRNISRWTESGSYRNLQRFFAAAFPWAEMLVRFFETHLFDPEEEYLLAGDATCVTKAGKQSFGLDRFFSGVLGQVVRGLEFFVFSLISVKARKSYPLGVGQTVRSEAEKAELKKKREARKKKLSKTKKKSRRGRGRPKGVRNEVREEPKYSAELLRINGLLKRVIALVRKFVSLRYLVLDGHFGHAEAVRLARENCLELISKLRTDAALYEKYEGVQAGRGRPRKYGKKLNYEQIPVSFLRKSEREGSLATNYYEGIFLSRKFKAPVKVVIIEKVNLPENKIGRVILFSSDENLSWEKVVQYYALRFQIEFNFREAKQHFGLEDFMNTTEKGVENAANLSFLMILLSEKLLADRKESCVGINDLKSQFRGEYYALETIKIVEPKAEAILIEKVKKAISRIGSIHRYNFSTSSA
jgi:putative transposase